MQPTFPVGKLAALRSPLQDLLAPCLWPGSQPTAPLAASHSLAWVCHPPSVLGIDHPGAAALVGALGLSLQRSDVWLGGCVC